MTGLFSVNKVVKCLRCCGLCIPCNDKRMEDVSTCKRIKVSMTDEGREEESSGAWSVSTKDNNEMIG